MTSLLSALVAGFLVLIFWVGPSIALVIYDSSAVVNIGVFSDPSTPQFISDEFTLNGETSTLNAIRWTGVYTAGGPIRPDNFEIDLFADAGGLPAMTPSFSLSITELSRLDTGIDIFADDLFVYSAKVSPITLPPHTTFWLSIVNDQSAGVFNYWAWGGQLLDDFSPNLIARRSSEESSWFLSSGFIQDFTISGSASVSEPATIILLGSGFLSLLLFRHYTPTSPKDPDPD